MKTYTLMLILSYSSPPVLIPNFESIKDCQAAILEITKQRRMFTEDITFYCLPIPSKEL